MRQPEILALIGDRVDFKAGTVHIDRQPIREKKRGGIYKYAPPKRDKPRKLNGRPLRSQHHHPQRCAHRGAHRHWGLRCHDLRHSYAVNSLRAGDDVKTVQSNLGHATAAFTLDKYAHYTEDMPRRAPPAWRAS